MDENVTEKNTEQKNTEQLCNSSNTVETAGTSLESFEVKPQMDSQDDEVDVQSDNAKNSAQDVNQFVSSFISYFNYLVDLLHGKPAQVIYAASQNNMGYVSLLITSLFGGLTVANINILLKMGVADIMDSLVSNINSLVGFLNPSARYDGYSYQPNYVGSYFRVFIICSIISALLLLLRSQIIAFLIKRREGLLPFNSSLTVVGLVVGWRNIFTVAITFLMVLLRASFLMFIVGLIFYIFGLFIDLLLYICISRFSKIKQSTIISYVLMKLVYVLVFIVITSFTMPFIFS